MLDKEESRIISKLVSWATGQNSEASTSALLAFYYFRNFNFLARQYVPLQEESPFSQHLHYLSYLKS